VVSGGGGIKFLRLKIQTRDSQRAQVSSSEPIENVNIAIKLFFIIERYEIWKIH